MKTTINTPPPEVSAVIANFRLSAENAGLPRSVVLAYAAGSEWRIGANVEGWGHTYIYRDQNWYVRDQRTGEDYPMRDGFEEAKAGALIFFTG